MVMEYLLRVVGGWIPGRGAMSVGTWPLVPPADSADANDCKHNSIVRMMHGEGFYDLINRK